MAKKTRGLICQVKWPQHQPGFRKSQSLTRYTHRLPKHVFLFSVESNTHEIIYAFTRDFYKRGYSWALWVSLQRLQVMLPSPNEAASPFYKLKKLNLTKWLKLNDCLILCMSSLSWASSHGFLHTSSKKCPQKTMSWGWATWVTEQSVAFRHQDWFIITARACELKPVTVG